MGITTSHSRAAGAHAVQRALRRTLMRRLARNGTIVAGLVLAALAVGAAGYHVVAGLPWLDAVLNAAMILTGMGPVAPMSTRGAKLFATVYALFSGVFFLTMVAVLLAPALHHLLHRFHLDLEEREATRVDRTPAKILSTERTVESHQTVTGL
jgi:hypothetical protein